ncbi:MAG: hypothetical protein M1827_005678 [Pycnora praestabilis]|nr:MAG: hypothetical protein M1827_005678 [Pycnora praestabilis]
MAMRYGSHAVLRVLLHSGADYRMKDRRSRTSLNAAAESSDIGTRELLTAFDLKGLDFQAKDILGYRYTAMNAYQQRKCLPAGFIPALTRSSQALKQIKRMSTDPMTKTSWTTIWSRSRHWIDKSNARHRR